MTTQQHKLIVIRHPYMVLIHYQIYTNHNIQTVYIIHYQKL